MKKIMELLVMVVLCVAMFIAGWVARKPISVSESMMKLSKHGIISDGKNNIFVNACTITQEDIKYLDVVSEHYNIVLE